MKRLSSGVLLVAFGCLLLLALSAAAGSRAGAKGRIVFVKHQSCQNGGEICGVGEIAVVNPDGSRLKVLEKLNAASPRWSPDGREIAYIRLGDYPAATVQVWLMAADGRYRHALTQLPQGVWSTGMSGMSSLDWAPNGRQIVFVAFSP